MIRPDEKVGKLGFGLMRLPQLKEENKDAKAGQAPPRFDIEQIKDMVDMFMEAGFNYFDTAWAYEGSEDAIRQALVERYPRESFLLATKNAAWIKCKTAEDAHAQFYRSLEQTGAGYFDYYLLHNLGENRTKFFDDFDLWNWLAARKEEGLIRHLGFSFHAGPEELDQILQEHPNMEFVQLQINYADWESPKIQSRACYEVARRHGKPVIIMEPVKGGTLATPPDPVKAVFEAAEPDSSCASWALRYCADLEGVLTVLSGMSNVEQMQDNLKVLKDFRGLTEEQRQVLARAREELDKIPIIPCTACEYCAKVCPNEIGISGSFEALNVVTLYNNIDFAKGRINWAVDGHGRKRATECIQCGACEKACPQHISIMEELKKAAELFG